MSSPRVVSFDLDTGHLPPSVETRVNALAQVLIDALDAGDLGAATPADVSAAINTAIAALVNGAPTLLNTLKEIADQLAVDETAAAAILTSLTAHTSDHANPHAVTKAQVGLGNADNTSDASKPVSTAQAAADAAVLAVAQAAKDRLVAAGATLPSVTAVDGGGVELHGAQWPDWGYGGNGSIKNPLSPTLLDLEELGVTQCIWFPGPNTYADRSITTPDSTALRGNVGSVAQPFTFTWDWVSNEWDPVTGASNYFFLTKTGSIVIWHGEDGFLNVRVFPQDASANVRLTSNAPIQIKTRTKWRVIFTPNNGGICSAEFQTIQPDGSWGTLGDVQYGSKAIAQYAENTNQVELAGGVGTGNLRGAFISAQMVFGTTTAFTVDAALWTPGAATYTGPQGNTWTIHNPDSSTWVTASCLAVGEGEYVTLTGQEPDETAISSPGLYTSFTSSGFLWRADVAAARDAYRDNNSIVNLAATPVEFDPAKLTVNQAGEIVSDALRMYLGGDPVATEDFAVGQASVARTGAVAESKAAARALVDALTAALSGGTAYTGAAATSGDVLIFNNQTYQAQTNIPAGLAPLGSGDGSLLDQALLLSNASGLFAAGGGDGGYGGTVRVITTLVDDAPGATVGSLRYHVNAHYTAWAADPTTRSVYIIDPTLADPITGVARIALAADFYFKGANWTLDGRGAPGGIWLDPGGHPGPVPYGRLASSAAPGTGTFTLTTTSSADYNKSKLRLPTGTEDPEKVDLGAYVSGVWTLYGTGLSVTGFSSAAKTITVTGTIDATAPVNAYVILSNDAGHPRYEPGILGKRVFVGGDQWNDVYGVGKPLLPPSNFIIHNVIFGGNWGGDVADTGDAKDLVIGYWANTFWIDHCSFSNPDPFHDVLLGITHGAGEATLSWNKFHDHYKAINHFNGGNGSGGVNPDGTTSNHHILPPAYTLADPGPFRLVLPKPGLHGNDFYDDYISIERATWHHNWLTGLGQRAPKFELYSEGDWYNNWVEKTGLPPQNSAFETTYRFPPDTLEAITNPVWGLAQNFSKVLLEGNIYTPHANASGSALVVFRCKKTGGSNGNAGYMVQRNNLLEGGAVQEPDSNPGGNTVPEWGSVYARVVEDVLSDSGASLKARLTAGAGAGTQSKLWKLTGTASIPSTIDVQKDGAELGSGGTEASSDTLNFAGPLVAVAYDSTARKSTVTVLDTVPTATKTASYTAAAGDTVVIDTSSSGTARVITLPANPTDGSRVVLLLLGLNGAVTYVPTTGDIFRDTGDAAAKSLTVVGRAVELTFRKSDRSWLRTSDGLPLSASDARYDAAGAAATALASAQTYADARLDANDALVYKGAIDASTNPNYPAANAGHTYRVSVAGKIGGASGANVEVGDRLTCNVDSTASGTQAAVGANWDIIQNNIDGAVVGPASSTAGDFATFSGTTGKVVQDSGISIDTDTTLAGNSNARIPSQKAVKAYVASAADAAGAAAAAQAASQPLDSDLTAIAALATTSIGRSLLAAADAAALRTILALGTAATQASTAFDASGAAAAAQAASQPLDSDLTAIAALTTTSYGRALLALADATALTALLNAATTSLAGIVPLATSAETITGAVTTKAVTPAGFAAAAAALTLPGAILAEARYMPNSSQTAASVASTTASIADAGLAASTPWGSDMSGSLTASRFDLTFAVPASRKVWIEFDLVITGSASGNVNRGTIVDPAATVTYAQVASFLMKGTGQVRAFFRVLVDYNANMNAGVSGVAAGTTVTVRPQITAASGTATIDVGGSTGGINAIARAA